MLNSPYRMLRNGLCFGLAGTSLVVVLSLQPARALMLDPPTTLRISVSATGTQGHGPSTYPALSADGRWIAFASEAADLVAGDTNGAADIFVKDRESGALLRASVSTGGVPAEGGSYAASISGDGARIAFASEGPNLVAGDQNGLPDVFVRDIAGGATIRVSVSSAGAEADGSSSAPKISADGRFVAFVSRATNLLTGDTNGQPDVFLRDLQAGTLERISVGATGEPADGGSEGAALSADGRYVAFSSTAHNLVAGESIAGDARSWDVYRRDRQTGATVRVNMSLTGGKGDAQSFAPAISADGRYVAFASLASNLITSDLNGKTDIYVRDMQSSTTQRVSIGLAGQEPAGESRRPGLSADGRFVVFESSAANLVSTPALEGSTWSYLRDLVAGTTTRVVAASAAPLPDGGTVSPAISSDGHWIAFSSAEPDLVGGDSNGLEDVFVRGPLP